MCHTFLDIYILEFVQIPIFEKGYEKDPAVVAKEAIQEATRNKSDVVLVDTAGRMQVG
jgi:signal recognition particle receptor subunit alpha